MPIKVACKCGQRFAAKDELAGKRVKCPKCGAPLLIPATAASRPQREQQPQANPLPKGKAAPQGRSAAAASPQANPVARRKASSVDDLLEEAGLQVAAQRCPNCRSAMPQGAILCIECGYNIKLGKKIQTVALETEEEAEEASRTAGDWKTRAERSLIEDVEEERKKTKQGMPWWTYLIMLLGLIAFTAGMMMISPVTVMWGAGWTLLVLGSLIYIVGSIWLLVEAFKMSILQGILVLLVPFYILVFVIMYWDDCTTPAVLWLGGIGLELVGFIMVLISPYMDFASEEAAMAALQLQLTAAALWRS